MNLSTEWHLGNYSSAVAVTLDYRKLAIRVVLHPRDVLLVIDCGRVEDVAILEDALWSTIV